MNQPRTASRIVIVAGFALVYLAVMVPTARTYPPFLNKAKSLGLPAQNCTYCHVNAAGGEPYNARGNWLMEEKKKRSVDVIDVAWLKQYKSNGNAKTKTNHARRKAGR